MQEFLFFSFCLRCCITAHRKGLFLHRPSSGDVFTPFWLEARTRTFWEPQEAPGEFRGYPVPFCSPFIVFWGWGANLNPNVSSVIHALFLGKPSDMVWCFFLQNNLHSSLALIWTCAQFALRIRIQGGGLSNGFDQIQMSVDSYSALLCRFCFWSLQGHLHQAHQFMPLLRGIVIWNSFPFPFSAPARFFQPCSQDFFFPGFLLPCFARH